MRMLPRSGRTASTPVDHGVCEHEQGGRRGFLIGFGLGHGRGSGFVSAAAS